MSALTRRAARLLRTDVLLNASREHLKLLTRPQTFSALSDTSRSAIGIPADSC
jgi:hypothetical protein